MKTKPFNLEEALNGAKVVTRDGREVKQLTYFDINDNFRLFGVIIEKNGENHLTAWRFDGKCSSSNESEDDLFIVIEPKRIYANVYKGKADYPYIGEYFKNKEKAKEFGSTSKTYIKTIEITDEV